MRKTEERNEKTMHLDRMTTEDMVAVMQEENYNAVRALETAKEAIGRAIDEIAPRMEAGGRLFYVGCGTSGRLGVLDASECPPTFGVSPDEVVGIIAGGDSALRTAAEGVEDRAEEGRNDLIARGFCEKDSVVGISAAGGAAYVLGALRYANECGALTVGLSCTAGSPLLTEARIAICTDTGAEVVTGSTRMKAGTAHKLVLNMLSTGVMVRRGMVYENMMIHLRPSNIKLRDRMIRIVCEISGVSAERAEAALDKGNWNIRAALREL